MGRTITRSISRALLKAGIERLGTSSIRIQHNRRLDALALRIRNVQVSRRLSEQPIEAAPIVNRRFSLQPAKSSLPSFVAVASTSREALQAPSDAILSTSQAIQSENMEPLSYSSDVSLSDNETDNVPSTSSFPGHTQKVGRKSYFTTAQMEGYVHSFVPTGQGENDGGRGISDQSISSESASAPTSSFGEEGSATSQTDPMDVEKGTTAPLDSSNTQGESDGGRGISDQSISSESASAPTGLFGADGSGMTQSDVEEGTIVPLDSSSTQGENDGERGISDQSISSESASAPTSSFGAEGSATSQTDPMDVEEGTTAPLNSSNNQGENDDGRHISDEPMSSESASAPTSLFGADGSGTSQADPTDVEKGTLARLDSSSGQGETPQKIVRRRFSILQSAPPMSRMNRFSLESISEVVSGDDEEQM